MTQGPNPPPPPTGPSDGAKPVDVGAAEQRLDVDAMRMLLEVSRRINAERDPAALLATVVDSLVSVTKADRGFLMLKEGTGLRFVLARDRKGRPLEVEKFRVSESVVKEVAEHGETRLIDDAANSEAYHARLSIINLSLRTILCVALKTARGILGVIYVDSNAITRRFSERDVPLVEAFAAQAAVSLERVRLQEVEIERDRMRRQLETAAEIQQTFLPGTFPESLGLDGAVASIPALQVGGDLYDVIRFPDGRTGPRRGRRVGQGRPRGAVRRAAPLRRAVRGAVPRRRRGDAGLGQRHHRQAQHARDVRHAALRGLRPADLRDRVRQRGPPRAARPHAVGRRSCAGTTSPTSRSASSRGRPSASRSDASSRARRSWS